MQRAPADVKFPVNLSQISMLIFYVDMRGFFYCSMFYIAASNAVEFPYETHAHYIESLRNRIFASINAKKIQNNLGKLEPYFSQYHQPFFNRV